VTRQRLLLAGVLVVSVLVLAACAAGPAPTATGPEIAGFWLGLWHGLISPITFVVALFNPHVGIYAVPNSGGWYDAGFMLGVMTVFSGPLSARRARPGPRTCAKDRS